MLQHPGYPVHALRGVPSPHHMAEAFFQPSIRVGFNALAMPVSSAGHSGYDIQKAFVFVFGAKAQVAGGVGSALCHCLGRPHHDVITPSNKSAPQCGCTASALRQLPPSQCVESAGPRVLLSLRAGWRRLVRFSNWLDNSWIGDLLGAACLFGLIWVLCFIAAALE